MVTLERVFTLTGGARRSLPHTVAPRVERATPFSAARPKWHSATLDALAEARDLLDRLENTGRTIRELRILDDARFEVRWRDPYAFPADVAR
jgi:hypothetical protein